MKIDYTYKIVKVDNESKIMEILYTPTSPDNLKPCLVGAGIPRENHLLIDIIQSYAPIGLWSEEMFNYQYVEEGVSGNLSCYIPDLQQSNDDDEHLQNSNDDAEYYYDEYKF